MGEGVNERLNWAAIDFPSDRLTLGDIRKKHLDLLIDSDRGAHRQYSQFDTFAMVAAEMDVAARVYARATGLPDPVDRKMSRDVLVKYLDTAYRKYGISAGLQTTEQLVRSIEAAAESQATEHTRPGR